jgi:hypothetical protein
LLKRPCIIQPFHRHAVAGGGDANIETTEVGNPHNSLPCKGNSHGEVGTDTGLLDTCPGSTTGR